MYKGHPWENEEFGAVEYEWYLERMYVVNVEFDLNFQPFLDFCKKNGIKSNHLLMKVSARLSKKYLPQMGISIGKRAYPVRYPAGYIRPVRKGSDMLEHIAVHEKEDCFEEVDIRKLINPYQRWFMIHMPRLSVFLGKYFFGKREMKKNYTIMVTRNPLSGLGRPITFSGTQYRSYLMCIPYGAQVKAVFGMPHVFGNINYYQDFLKEYIKWVEEPETIPEDLMEKEYKTAPPNG